MSRILHASFFSPFELPSPLLIPMSANPQAACSGSVDVARLLVEHAAPLNSHTVKYITQEVLEAQVRLCECGFQIHPRGKPKGVGIVYALNRLITLTTCTLLPRRPRSWIWQQLQHQQVLVPRRWGLVRSPRAGLPRWTSRGLSPLAAIVLSRLLYDTAVRPLLSFSFKRWVL